MTIIYVITEISLVIPCLLLYVYVSNSTKNMYRAPATAKNIYIFSFVALNLKANFWVLTTIIIIIIIIEKTEAGLERPLYPRNRYQITSTCYIILQ